MNPLFSNATGRYRNIPWMLNLADIDQRGDGCSTEIYRCNCVVLRWPWKDGTRAVRLDACDWERHGKPMIELVENIRFVTEEMLQVCWDEQEIPGEFIYVNENLAPVQEKE